MKDKKNIVIGALLLIVLAMAVGYAAFATQLNINGSAEITGKWDVKIKSIEGVATGTAAAGEPTKTDLSATFKADLKKPGDKVTYTITVENAGNIPAKLKDITLTPQVVADLEPQATGDIEYTVTEQPSQNDILNPTETDTIVVEVTYKSDATSVPSIKTRTFTGVLDYEQTDAE